MDQKMPVGIQVARGVNLVFVLSCLAVGILMAMIAVPNVIKAAAAAGRQANPFIIIFVGLGAFSLSLIPAALLVFLNKKLKEFKASARTWQIITSCFLLLGFPLGTLLSIVVLYFMIFDQATKEALVQ